MRDAYEEHGGSPSDILPQRKASLGTPVAQTEPGPEDEQAPNGGERRLQCHQCKKCNPEDFTRCSKAHVYCTACISRHYLDLHGACPRCASRCTCEKHQKLYKKRKRQDWVEHPKGTAEAKAEKRSGKRRKTTKQRKENGTDAASRPPIEITLLSDNDDDEAPSESPVDQVTSTAETSPRRGH